MIVRFKEEEYQVDRNSDKCGFIIKGREEGVAVPVVIIAVVLGCVAKV